MQLFPMIKGSIVAIVTPMHADGSLDFDGLNKLIDTAWNCLDLNASVLASMPVYRMSSGQVGPPMSWMTNPDPMVYTSWQEFAKQLFWDYQMGEAFVLPMAHAADGYPLRFRVVPPWLEILSDSGIGKKPALLRGIL